MKHCWHETGESHTNMLGLFSEVICCNCGGRALRKYIEEDKGLPGHGKYYSRRTMVPLPVEYEEECEEK